MEGASKKAKVIPEGEANRLYPGYDTGGAKWSEERQLGHNSIWEYRLTRKRLFRVNEVPRDLWELIWPREWLPPLANQFIAKWMNVGDPPWLFRYVLERAHTFTRWTANYEGDTTGKLYCIGPEGAICWKCGQPIDCASRHKTYARAITEPMEGYGIGHPQRVKYGFRMTEICQFCATPKNRLRRLLRVGNINAREWGE